MHMKSEFRRGMTAICLTAALLLCCGCSEESSVTMPQSQSTASTDDTTTTETTTTTAASTDDTTATSDTTTTDSEGAEDTTTSATETTVTTTTTATSIDSADGYLLDELAIGADCTAYVTAHTDYYLQEAASCMGEGTDRVYTYADYILYTFYDGTTDTLLEINLTGESVKTRLGASIGMTQAEVEALYGTSPNGIYETEDGCLEFSYADNTVILIAVYEPM